jgi:CDP-glucose 4,6-dehydratase
VAEQAGIGEAGAWFAGRVVLVTGAQGFIGSWLTERLLDLGAAVVVPQRDVPARSRFQAEGLDHRCQLVQADVTDFQAMLRVLLEHQVSAVVHLAAQAIVGIANAAPLSTFETNVRGTYTVLEACRVSRGDGVSIERIIVASSDKAYGEIDLPYREDALLQPRYPYDVSKASADMIARSFACTFAMPIAVTRLANVYGGGDFNFDRLVPDTVRALVRGARPVLRSDGTAERDFIYVEDAVNAYLAVAASLGDPSMYGRPWNAGSGRSYPVLEVVQELIDISGREVEPDIRGSGTPHGEIDRQWLDATVIRERLGWQPQWDLRRGLEATYRWYERWDGEL